MTFRAAIYKMAFAAVVFGSGFSATAAQNNPPPKPLTAPPSISPTPRAPATPSLETLFSQKVPDLPTPLPVVSAEQRSQAYAKLLEGQRHYWNITNRRMRSQGALVSAVVNAHMAFRKAIEIDPTLAEAYTALAELGFELRIGTPAELERIAGIAVRLDPNSFGARRFLALTYTVQSGLAEATLKRDIADKAVAQWLEVVRLDPRNSEAWAFLSELYERSGQTEKQIEALRRWNGAAAPLDDRYFRTLTGNAGMSPGAAVVPLGRALVRAGKSSEAIVLLSRTVSDEPENAEAAAALQEALETATPAESANAIQALQQAVFAAPTNTALIEVLANTQLRVGKFDDSVKTLRNASERLAALDKQAAANLLVQLGSIYADEMRPLEAAAAYEQALSLAEIGNLPLQTEPERELAARVIPRLVTAYRQAGKTNEARAAVARLGTLLGKTDPTADEQLIELLRGAGDHQAALTAVRDARKRFPQEPSLLRLEANVLTDLGKVDEAVTLLRSKIVNKTKQIAVPESLIADFIAHLTISGLYSQAGRGGEAVAAARQALDLSQNDEMSRIGLLTLATAQNSAGDFKSAESSLREVLKNDPNNATALNNLGYFMVERGERLTEAVEMIRKAVEREPNNASFLDSLGWAHFKMNQLDQAEKYLTEAARRSPQSAMIQNHLGDLYERQGKREQARAAWRKALNLSSDAAESEKIKAKLGETKKSGK